MATNEGQPSGPNPEWEIDKTRNIAIAKKISGLISNLPDPVEVGMSRLGQLGALIGLPDGWIPEDKAYDIARHSIINGYTIELSGNDNPRKRIVLEVAQSKENEDKGSHLNMLPKEFNFPVRAIHEQVKVGLMFADFPLPTLYVTSPYEKVPSNILGLNKTCFTIRNFYCFNTWGQGIKFEDVSELMKIEDFENHVKMGLSSHDEMIRYLKEFTNVDFVPSEEHSRVVPLTQEDYLRVNKMFKDIDAGLYEYRT